MLRAASSHKCGAVATNQEEPQKARQLGLALSSGKAIPMTGVASKPLFFRPICPHHQEPLKPSEKLNPAQLPGTDNCCHPWWRGPSDLETGMLSRVQHQSQRAGKSVGGQQHHPHVAAHTGSPQDAEVLLAPEGMGRTPTAWEVAVIHLARPLMPAACWLSAPVPTNTQTGWLQMLPGAEAHLGSANTRKHFLLYFFHL